jgi:mannosyl-3-phosphoglycerate phosphatase
VGQLIISDLDGTLLDHHSYDWRPAESALAAARAAGVPVVLCTSKTRAEALWWQRELGLEGMPCIVENGGAVVWGPGEVDGLGVPYGRLRQVLRECAVEADRPVRGFGDMGLEEVMRACELPADQAERARQREWDEPFVADQDPEELLAAIRKRGLSWSRGGRFYHIHGKNDKAESARRVIARFGRRGPVASMGLGDGLNDATFLQVVDVPVLMPSATLEALQRMVPQGRVAVAPGPKGWAAAVLAFLAEAGMDQ